MLGDGQYAVPQGKLPVIVTYLEMHARAATKDAALPAGLTFRQVTPTLAWYRDVFSRVGSQDWLWYGRLKLSDAELQAILDDPQVHFYTLTKDGRDEALLELDFRESGACELAYFGLTSALIGTGAGRYLMDRAIDLAWLQDIKRFHVHTCTIDSPQALGFYVRSGFTPYKREVEIDDDPRSIGLLPETHGARTPII
ncbi:GNAT family N-acetyltransferase [uncultured Sulfitobacter sp.]|uniref:GNAT family N-acetyltransferase n=1 Tax=uncultured Sulfitobacter sp. TaxID=191468 RepID=UPI00260ECA3E|nr:GNAT family N-acetyltransferase [uncultured Sulfitobacter sp.]